jgi:hypothetical protein
MPPVTINVNGHSLTFSPLTLRGARAFDETLTAIREKKLTGIAAVMATVPIALESLRKAHPDLTIEKLEEILTIPDIDAVQSAFLEASGMTLTAKTDVGESAPVA